MAGQRRPPQGQQAPSTPEGITDSTPRAGFGSVDHSFTLQAILDLKQTVGELKATIESSRVANDKACSDTEKNLDRIAERLDKFEDKLSGATHWIYAATLIVVLAAGVFGWVFTEMWSVAKPLLVDRLQASSQTTSAPQPPHPPSPTTAAK